MKIVCASNDGSHRITFAFNIWLHLVLPALFVAILMGMYVTTQVKKDIRLDSKFSQLLPIQFVVKNDKPAVIVKQAVTDVGIDMDILSKRLGILEAESLRLNAFGSRIVKMAKLDPEEFAFDEMPSRGGLRSDDDSENQPDSEAGYGISSDELMKSIDLLERQLIDQRNRLEGMLHVLNGRIIDREIKPNGMPIEKGYVSSNYGFRRDPFTGRKRLHKGIDFAGRMGTPVKTVGGGIVQFVGKKGGYGNVVEIDHRDGIVSRYAHLSVIKVNLDQVVKKGERIGLVGSTGRSTGPHLHLEVLKDGIQQNPAKFF